MQRGLIGEAPSPGRIVIVHPPCETRVPLGVTPKAVAAMGPERGLALSRVAQPPVHPLAPPMRLGMRGADQARDDAVHPAQGVETMRPGGRPFCVAGQPVGTRALVSSQDRVDGVRKRGQDGFDGRRHRGHVAPGQDGHPHSARGAGTRDKA